MSYPNIKLKTLEDKFSFIASILTKHKFLLLSYVFVTILLTLVGAVLPYFLKLQLDQLENKHESLLSFQTDSLLIFIVLLLIPFVFEFIRMSVLYRINQKHSILLNSKIRLTTERLIWEKINTLDAGFFQSKRNKKIFTDALNSSNIVERTFLFVTQRFTGFLAFFTILPLLALVNWQLVVLVVTASILQLLVSKSLKLKSEGYTLAESRINDQVWRIYELLEHHFYEIKMMGNIDLMIDEYQKLKMNSDRLVIRRDEADMFLRSISWFLDNGLLLITNIFVGYQVMYGGVSIGTFMLVVAYTQQINSFFNTLVNSLSEWQETDFQLTRLGFFFALKSRIKTVENPVSIPECVTSIALENVTFSYPDHSEDEKEYLRFLAERLEKWMKTESSGYYRREIEEIEQLLNEKNEQKIVLKNVSLKLEKGKITALVGRNGSGKTTITHLLQHHYEPSQGRILLEDMELYQYEQEQLIRQFSWLTQQPLILERQSLGNNLLLGSKKIKNIDEKMNEVLKDLHLDDFIQSLPKKLETVIDEDTSLSGGQKQLLAIGRTLIQNRPFLIFDEGSSQLDVEKEFLVLQLLQKAKENAGILFITHRMSVARKADYIYVIDAGEIVQEGKHTQLIEEKNSLYAKFWAMQMVE